MTSPRGWVAAGAGNRAAALLCQHPEDRQCDEPDEHDLEHDSRQRVAERRPVADPQEEKRVLETVRLWISLRESAKTDGAAALSTSDIVVRTPLGEVSGIDQVRQHVYCAASPPLVSSTPLAAVEPLAAAATATAAA